MDGKPYREWAVPAKFVRSLGKVFSALRKAIFRRAEN
jgi:hypothetical protein